MALSIMSILLSSCTSKEQKAAEEYLKNTMKSPSSFEVIEVKKSEHEASTSYDTIYHIGSVYETKGSYRFRLSLDSVFVDSIQIWRIEYPAIVSYSIEYDAANSFGAILRDKEDVYVTADGETYFPNEFIGKCIDEKILDHTEVFSRIYSKGIGYSIERGEWVDRYQIGLY